jgi:hypothetical protein
MKKLNKTEKPGFNEYFAMFLLVFLGSGMAESIINAIIK